MLHFPISIAYDLQDEIGWYQNIWKVDAFQSNINVTCKFILQVKRSRTSASITNIRASSTTFSERVILCLKLYFPNIFVYVVSWFCSTCSSVWISLLLSLVSFFSLPFLLSFVVFYTLCRSFGNPAPNQTECIWLSLSPSVKWLIGFNTSVEDKAHTFIDEDTSRFDRIPIYIQSDSLILMYNIEYSQSLDAFKFVL